ncbi:hypothetical protein ACEQ8H_001562 [Pleosporales sp. CAS-2024a]
MSQPTAWSGPGMILSFFKLRESSSLSEKTLEDWFDQEFGPSLMALGVIKSAWLYQAANASYDKQNAILYEVPDLALIQAGKLQEASRISKLGLFQGSVDDHIELDTRLYSFVERAAPVILMAMIQPAPGGEADLDAWYRQEHNEQMSKEPGYWRTTRLSLLHQNSTGKAQSEKLSFLAIHAFGDGNTLGTEVKPLDPITDWTKKVMSEAKGMDVAIYHKRKVFGAKS